MLSAFHPHQSKGAASPSHAATVLPVCFMTGKPGPLTRIVLNRLNEKFAVRQIVSMEVCADVARFFKTNKGDMVGVDGFTYERAFDPAT